MSETSARPGVPPSTSVNSVKPAEHGLRVTTAVGTADPSPPQDGPSAGPDLMTILLLAVVAAVAVRIYWRALVDLLVVAALTLVFAGILVPVMMTATAGR